MGQNNILVRKEGRKEEKYLFNHAHNTFYLRLYGKEPLRYENKSAAAT